MESEKYYSLALKNMARTVDELATKVPRPIKVPYKKSFVFRYVEKTIQQAIIQKLARVVSTLSACHVLMQLGFVQEQAALQRILHELHEDITFLAYAYIHNDSTKLHQDYLDAFYEEEFDANTPVASTQKRPMPPRKKIQAYIANKEGSELDPSTSLELARTLTKTYSGFVHAASPQIMDMYGGDPPRFHTEGMLGTWRHAEYRQDIWNYFYRSILAFGLAAHAFKDVELINQITEFLDQFELVAGKKYSKEKKSGST